MADPRWLTPDEQSAWVSFLIAARLLFARLERDIQRGAGMPLTYYEVLSVLSNVPDRSLRLSELAERLQVSPSRLSHAADRMEASGWIRREPSPGDRRGALAVLTDAGYAVLETAAPFHVESVRVHLLDQLSPGQLTALENISRTLLAHLAGDAGDVSSGGLVKG